LAPLSPKLGAQALTRIPGVERFEALRQTSRKNSYTVGVSMEFADAAAAYQRYNVHPEHVRFVQQRWLKEVDEVLEIDHEALG
jgi:hypothetical protein